MSIIFRVSLILLIFISQIYCQGTGSRTGRTHFYRGRRSNSLNKDFQYPNTMIGYVITFGIFLIFLMALHHLWINSFPMLSNEDYVNTGFQGEICDQFQSGFWLSRYYQHDSFHGHFRFLLSFDSTTCKVTGNGIDDIGQFVIEGIYSTETNRIAFVKKYQRRRNNSIENHGHHVTIQVAWNPNPNQFEGKWFIKTKNYSGEGKFELYLQRTSRSME